tara:strand:+ start:2698 stop:3132 length:435 start_codon:yes stop_codon:yes gene_type:complete
MAISNTMNFKVLTLIDITQTGQNKFKSEDREAINQQANWNTFLQVLGMRANPYFEFAPKMTKMEIEGFGFGESFKGEQNVWEFDFSVEQEGATSVDALKEDFDLIPVIAGLTESITVNNTAFRTTGNSTNIVFILVDNEQTPVV